MKISVVMATFNGEKYLEEQLDSILSQTVFPDELIICDDGSVDGTVAILERYQQRDLLKFSVNPQRLGLVDNFKKAVSLARKTNYIALSDQDDFWLPDKLEKSAEAIRALPKGSPCMVHTDLKLIDENGNLLNGSFRNELGQDVYQQNLHTLVYGNFVNGCTMLINPVLSGYFKDIPSDVLLNHDGWMALAAFTFGETRYVEEPLVVYRKHGRNLSIAADAKPRNRFRSTFLQILKAASGNDDFLSAQFETVRRFYTQYQELMTTEKKKVFIDFLTLENRSYFFKKLAFRKIIKRFSLTRHC